MTTQSSLKIMKSSSVINHQIRLLFIKNSTKIAFGSKHSIELFTFPIQKANSYKFIKPHHIVKLWIFVFRFHYSQFSIKTIHEDKINWLNVTKCFKFAHTQKNFTKIMTILSFSSSTISNRNFIIKSIFNYFNF